MLQHENLYIDVTRVLKHGVQKGPENPPQISLKDFLDPWGISTNQTTAVGRTLPFFIFSFWSQLLKLDLWTHGCLRNWSPQVIQSPRNALAKENWSPLEPFCSKTTRHIPQKNDPLMSLISRRPVPKALRLRNTLKHLKTKPIFTIKKSLYLSKLLKAFHPLTHHLQEIWGHPVTHFQASYGRRATGRPRRPRGAGAPRRRGFGWCQCFKGWGVWRSPNYRGAHGWSGL